MLQIHVHFLSLLSNPPPPRPALPSCIQVSSGRSCSITVGGHPQISGDVGVLRDVWEETSFVLERMQAAEECVAQEQAGLKDAKAPKWVLPFTPTLTPKDKITASDKVRHVCVCVKGGGGGWVGDLQQGAGAAFLSCAACRC